MENKQPLLALLCVLAFILSGCNTLPNIPLNLTVNAHHQLNPDTNQQPLPVRVKLYQLSDPTPFQEATFRQLWKDDAKILESTLLSKKEITVLPSTTEAIQFKKKPQAEYLGIIAIFRQQENTHWKAIRRIPDPIITYLSPININLKKQRVEFRDGSLS